MPAAHSDGREGKKCGVVRDMAGLEPGRRDAEEGLLKASPQGDNGAETLSRSLGDGIIFSSLLHMSDEEKAFW